MSKNNIENISDLLRNKIKTFNHTVSSSEEGKVISIADGIASVSGLSNVGMGETLLFPNNLLGVALTLEEDFVGVILLGEYLHVKEGDTVKQTGNLLSIPFSEEVVGRIINPLGEPIDGGKSFNNVKYTTIEKPAKSIMDRQAVEEPLQTGILSIDSLIPIGKGQRELIIGDRKTGKTAIALDTIINQQGKNVKCIYVSIGQKNSTLAVTAQKLKDAGAMEYTTIIAANSSDSDALKYFAPYSGISIAEEWMDNGEDVLIVFDDLSKHAVAYRTISLLLRRPPGREAYPGDVFYLHSRLLERAAKVKDELGGGSITALPIIETQAGDISAYIPTNVISITDGQIFLMSDAFNSGQRPAVDAGLSVSRVGGAAQTKLMKKMASSLKLELASYNELKAFSEFSSDLDDTTKDILAKGTKTMEVLKQAQYKPLNQETQAILLYFIKSNLIQKISLDKISDFKIELNKHINRDQEFLDLIKIMKENKTITKEETKILDSLLVEFIEMFNKGTIVSK